MCDGASGYGLSWRNFGSFEWGKAERKELQQNAVSGYDCLLLITYLQPRIQSQLSSNTLSKEGEEFLLRVAQLE